MARYDGATARFLGMDYEEWVAEVEAMSKPPRNAWGGAKTEQEWLDLQESFQRHQAIYDEGGTANGSNSRSARPENPL